MTLKNALNHFVNTTEGKQKPSESCTFSFGFAPAALENHPPQTNPTTAAAAASPPLFPYWSLSGAKSDMRHISAGLELSLRGPHSEHH